MKKLTLMKRFMKQFVGQGVHLVIAEKEGRIDVFKIEIMQKTDESCPVEDLPVGDYFLHLVGATAGGAEASVVCDWSDELLKNLLANYKEAKDAESRQVTMFRDPISGDPNRWLLIWGNSSEKTKPKEHKKDPIRYIS